MADLSLELPSAPPKQTGRSYGRLADVDTPSNPPLGKQTVAGTVHRARPGCGWKSGKAGRACEASGSLAPVTLSSFASPQFTQGEDYVQPVLAESSLPRNQNSLYRLRDVGVRTPLREPNPSGRSADSQTADLSSLRTGGPPTTSPEEAARARGGRAGEAVRLLTQIRQEKPELWKQIKEFAERRKP